jgi:Lon protease-like protein
MSSSAGSVIVPVFPLDSVLLVPGGLLPLHVFEPRYRALVADAVAGERRIAMALPRLGHSVDGEEAPPLHPVCGMGLIVHHDLLADGRSHIVLLGQERVRIVKELESGRPYRLVRAEIVEDVLTAGEEIEARARNLLQRLGNLTSEDRARLEGLPPGRLVDAVLALLPAPIQDRHRIHANPDVAWRLAEVETLADILQGSRYRTEIPPEDPRMN